jgi:ABC-2 type transport system permease protein
VTAITARLPARARGALAAEWIKLRSVRSTYLALAAAAVTAVALGYLVTHYQANTTPTWAHMSRQARATWDPVSFSLVGLAIAQLAFGVLGVLAISSEHTTGLIRTTLAALPRRRAVLAAKAAATGAVTLVAGELIAFATFYTGQQALSAKHLNMALAHPGVLRGVLAAGLYLAVITLVGLGLGALIRHTAGATAALFGLVFLIPQVIHAMPAPWNTSIGKYMLDNAGQQMTALHGAPGYLSPGPSLIICLAYAAAALAAAAVVITRRDA